MSQQPEPTVEELLAEIKAILEAPTPAFEAALNSPKMLAIATDSYKLAAFGEPYMDDDKRREMSRLWLADEVPTGYLYIQPGKMRPVVTQGEGNVVHLSFERTRAKIIS